MLVRLLGKEAEAKAGEYEHPFTDVPEWADQYVGFLYENGLTKGKDQTTFGTADLCSANMYVTFVLRALGYDDAAGDFTYENAVTFGNETSVSDAIIAGGEFKRGNLVAVSFQSLLVQPKDKSEASLLAKLVTDKAVSAESAKALTDKKALYEEYLKAAEAYESETRLEMAMDMKAAIDLGEKIDTTTKGTASVIMEGDKIQMAMDMEITANGEAQKSIMYYKDNMMYMDAAGQKIKMPMPMDDALASAKLVNLPGDPFYMVKEIKKTTEDGKAVYTLELLMPEMSEVLGMMENLGLDASAPQIRFEDVSVKLAVGADGKIKDISIAMKYDMTMTIEGETIEAKCDMVSTVAVTRTGSAVTITFPDFSDYKDISEIAPQPEPEEAAA